MEPKNKKAVCLIATIVLLAVVASAMMVGKKFGWLDYKQMFPSNNQHNGN